VYLHCATKLIVLLSPPTLLVAEHLYSPLSSLDTLVTTRDTLVAVSFTTGSLMLNPSPRSLPSTPSHTIFGRGKPVAVQSIVVDEFSLIIIVDPSIGTVITGTTTRNTNKNKQEMLLLLRLKELPMLQSQLSPVMICSGYHFPVGYKQVDYGN